MRVSDGIFVSRPYLSLENIFSRPPACISAPPSLPLSAAAVTAGVGTNAIGGGAGVSPSAHPHQGSLASTVTLSLFVLLSASFIAV